MAASLEELVGKETASMLVPGGEAVIALQPKNPTARLLPRHAELQNVFNGAMREVKPNMLVESLALRKKPQGEKSWDATQRAALFNHMAAISTFARLQYFSQSKNTMRTLYETSVVVNGSVEKKPLPDPVFETPPESLTLYARQKDSAFGDNIYRFYYRSGADYVFFKQENLTPLSTGIITAVAKNKFNTIVAVVDAGEHYLVYVAALADAASMLGMGDRIGASLTNRVKALLDWVDERNEKFIFPSDVEEEK